MPPDKNKSVFGSNSVNCLLDTIHYRHQNTVELRCFHKIGGNKKVTLNVPHTLPK